MKLEELLNKLIQRWWKPRKKEEVKRLNYHTLYREVVSLEFDNYNLGVSYSIRDLVSKESGLWQFVCENKKLHNFPQIRIKNPTLCDEWIKDVDKDCNDNFYEYWLIECALCDEKYLEQFLIDNIKVNE